MTEKLKKLRELVLEVDKLHKETEEVLNTLAESEIPENFRPLVYAKGSINALLPALKKLVKSPVLEICPPGITQELISRLQKLLTALQNHERNKAAPHPLQVFEKWMELCNNSLRNGVMTFGFEGKELARLNSEIGAYKNEVYRELRNAERHFLGRKQDINKVVTQVTKELNSAKETAAEEIEEAVTELRTEMQSTVEGIESEFQAFKSNANEKGIEIEELLGGVKENADEVESNAKQISDFLDGAENNNTGQHNWQINCPSYVYHLKKQKRQFSMRLKPRQS
jgi:archaellum component FlaC